MSTQTSFDVEAIEAANRHQQDMELPSGKSSNRREGGKKAAATRKANAAKKAQPEPVKAGGITEDQAVRLRNLTAFAFEKREAFAQAEDDLRNAEAQLDVFITGLTKCEV